MKLILHDNACQHYLTTGMCNCLFDERGFAEHHSRRLWAVSENALNSQTIRYIARPLGLHYNRYVSMSSVRPWSVIENVKTY